MEQDLTHAVALRSAYAGTRVFVAGGSGFIGRALTVALAGLGAEVVALGLRPDAQVFGHPSVSRLVADMANRRELLDAFSGQRYDYAFNFGGYINHCRYLEGGRGVIDTHLGGLLNLLEALGASALKGFVQIGSSDEYGRSPAPQAEDQREAPISPYSAAKAAGTHLIQALARTEAFPGVVVRYFLVYGPGQDRRRFVPQVIAGALNDDVFPTSAGVQLRDFCYLDDAVSGTLLAAAQPRIHGQVVNIASGRPVAVREVVEAVVRLVGAGRPQFGAHPLRADESMALYADTTKARDFLGFEATTSLEDGLSRTIAWFREEKEPDDASR